MGPQGGLVLVVQVRLQRLQPQQLHQQQQQQVWRRCALQACKRIPGGSSMGEARDGIRGDGGAKEWRSKREEQKSLSL